MQVTNQESIYNQCIVALTAANDKYPNIAFAFVSWFKNGGWDDEGIIDDFEEVMEESSFIDWIIENENIEEYKTKQIFNLLQNIIIKKQKKMSEKISVISPIISNNAYRKYGINQVVEILLTEITAKEQKKYIQSIQSPLLKNIQRQIPSFLYVHPINKKTHYNHDVLYVELLGFKNNIPLLLYLNDASVRCSINQGMLKYDRLNGYSSISVRDFFYKHCTNKQFKHYINHIRSNLKLNMETIICAIESYRKQALCPHMSLRPLYQIDEDPLALCEYMFKTATIVRHILHESIHSCKIIPMQLDFLILNGKIKRYQPCVEDCAGVSALFSSDDSYDEEEEEEEE
eukprot:186947_1